MRPEICPSVFNLVPVTDTESNNENDIYKPDRFKVLQAENLTKIKEIVANTTNKQPLQVRLILCYRTKGLTETYCTDRSIINPAKQICSDKTGIKTIFIHFHVKMENIHHTEYLLAFIEGSDLNNNAVILIKEMFSLITWLEIDSSEVHLNVFTFGELFSGIRNTAFKEEHINSARNQATRKYEGIIDCKITHISKDHENRLSVSLNSGCLVFTPS
jgi:hypothetical protein